MADCRTAESGTWFTPGARCLGPREVARLAKQKPFRVWSRRPAGKPQEIRKVLASAQEPAVYVLRRSVRAAWVSAANLEGWLARWRRAGRHSPEGTPPAW